MSKTAPRPSTSHITPFGLRMQPELKERLEEAATEAGRSLNAEIVARLEASFTNEGGLTDLDKEFLLSIIQQMRASHSENQQLDLLPGTQSASTPARAKNAGQQLDLDVAAQTPAAPPKRRIRVRRDPKT